MALRPYTRMRMSHDAYIQEHFDELLRSKCEINYKTLDLNLEAFDQPLIRTLRVSNNGTWISNVVNLEYLTEHVEYNKDMRFGQALFVEGMIATVGYLGLARCVELLPEVRERNDSLPLIEQAKYR